jgi:CubicO group peptidase (beta-lactamase class C family)/dienelactone hydrolase
VTRLTENEAPEERPTYSPDGKWIAYHSPDARWYDLHDGYLWIMNASTGEARKLDGQCRGEIGEFVWSRDGKAILFSESRGVNTNLYRLDVATDAVEAVTAIEGTLRPRAFSQNGRRVVYTREDFATPPDLYASNLRGQGEVRLTSCNAWITKERLLGEGRTARWRSADGREVEGVLVLPSDVDPGTKLPLILNIHGGPPGFFGNEFDPEFHLHAGLGFAVLGPNPRGSSSYGDDFLRALMGDVGGGEYDDLMSGVDHLIGEGVVDPDRLALRGWSWGGILGAWTITRTNRFAAASLGAMVGDWFAETGGGVMFDMRLHYIGSEPYADPAEWRKRSALTYVANVVTPTLLLHGEDDDVSTVNQSLMFYTALRDRGVPVRMIKLPRQGHSIREPRLDRIRAVEEIRFIQHHANHVEWASGPFVPRASEEGDAIASQPAPDLSWLAADRVLSEADRYLIDRMHAGKVPGLAAAVVAGGRIIYSGGFGWAEIEKQRPVTTDTLFQLASVSKTVAACVVMQCVENGALDLDADIDALLPFEVNHPSHPDAKITLRQLLTHTAGLRDDWEVLEGTWVKNGDFPRSLGSSLREYLTPHGAWYDATENFQEWAPGTAERYSNVGIALAAYLAEVAAGRPFEELCAERVFRPLGMDHSSFRLRDLDFRDLAMPYVVGSDGRFEPQGHHGYLDFPSGTLRTSVTQLARFLLSFIGDGALGEARVLRPETVEAMRRVQFPEIAPEQGLVWHYGELGGRRVLGHDGGDPGVATVMRYRPDDGVGVILLTNGDLESGVEEQLLERLFALASP